jgi:2-polyprenyl-6-methoxyphenol hydroxylase-like FAD-dependent oxidoreductase
MNAEPILVVGAGPVGLVVASELARAGVPVRIIDKLPEPSPWSKAVVVHARSLELLETLGIENRFIDQGVRTVGASLIAEGKTLAELDFTHVDTAYPFAASLPQDTTESILRDLLSTFGVETERPVELVGLTQDDGTVTATMRRADGRDESAAFSYAVGCDGGHSSVRSLVGSKLEGSFEGTSFLLADCDVDHSLARDRIYLYFAPEGIFALFPLPGARCRIAAQLAGKPTPGSEPTLEPTQRLADERTNGALRLSNPRWLTYFEIHEAQVPSYRIGRVFLAGDAAHVHSPAGGQGMNTGMQDAVNLAWKLRLAWLGDAAPGLLDSYQAERHPVGAHVVRVAGLMTSAGTKGSGSLARHAREFLVTTLVGHTPLHETLARELTETHVSYHHSPIVHGLPRRTVGHDPLHPGDLAPLPGNLGASIDPLAHTALLFSGGSASEATAERLHANFGSVVRPVLVEDPEGTLGARYGVGEGLLAIVRPDRYLAYLGEPEDLEGAERALALAIG